MTDNTTPVVVSANAGLIDGAQSALRSIGLLLAFGVAIVGFVRTKDLAGLASYVHANGGQATAAVSGLIGFGLYAYGIYKSHKRGSQVATVAADNGVPDTVAHLK